MGDLTVLSAAELLAGYRSHDFSPVEVVDALAARIESVEPRLKAFVTLALDEARADAQRAERAWRAETPRPLEGVPFAAKDLFDTAGVRTTYGSTMFTEHVPAQDAAAVRAAKAAGAILLGKTSTHEFAWGITGYNRVFDSGRNPWALERISGGSSGGSAAALAADEVPLALGTDTGGSIRMPAAFCGVVGLKPTFGRVSAVGVFPLAPSLDHVGPLARNPRDAALLLSALTGGRWLAPEASVPASIALSEDLIPVAPIPAVRRALDDVATTLSELGADLVELPFAAAAEIRNVFGVIQQAEALRTHRAAGLWPDRRDEYGDDVRGRLDAAEAIDLGAYVEATTAREHIRARFVDFFGQADLLLTPVSPASPAELGSEQVLHGGEPRPFRELVLPSTTPQNLDGLPACAVRAGFDALGLPIGVQLTGPPGSESVVVAWAQALFEATPELQARRPSF